MHYTPPPSLPSPPAASPGREWQSIVIIAAGLRATATAHYSFETFSQRPDIL